MSLDEAKKVMQAVMRNNSEVIWNTNQSLFKGKYVTIEGKKFELSKWEHLRDVASHTDFLKSNILNFVEVK